MVANDGFGTVERVPTSCRAVLALCGTLLCGALSSAARADPVRWSVKLDPSVAFPLTGPQREAFGVGGGGFAKGAYGPLDWLDVQLDVGGLGFAPKHAPTAGLFALGGGVRFQLPQRRFRVSPFLEASVLYARTGDLDRFAYAVAAGVLAAVDHERRFWLGVHVRYLQVVQPSRSGFDTTDADLLLIGISSQLGAARRHEAPRTPEPPRADSDGDGVLDDNDQCPNVAGTAALHGCPERDRDHDGVLEPDDACPDKAGPATNAGCPVYRTVVVTDNSIELNQKIFFAYDLADILPKSYEVLDDVATVLRDREKLRVRIEGHTDEHGAFKHNLELSLARARSVMRYLVDHGVAAERLSAMGYGSTQPLDTNKTAAGRERNRRVEFVIEHDQP